MPNKHLPFCSPGPRPGHRQLDTPPASPPSPSQLIETTSLTYPPNASEKLFNDPPVYSIGAKKLSQALDHLATQPLPSPKQVFPWLHGLHAENQLQLAFFIARKKTLRRTPKCIRAITIVKAGGDLTHSRINGAISPEELLKPSQGATAKNVEEPEFLDSDPKEGFSVRNFQIQTCKMATVSDIVVYGDNQTPREEVVRLAKRISKAQMSWQKKTEGVFTSGRSLNTFILSGEHHRPSEVRPLADLTRRLHHRGVRPRRSGAARFRRLHDWQSHGLLPLGTTRDVLNVCTQRDCAQCLAWTNAGPKCAHGSQRHPEQRS